MSDDIRQRCIDAIQACATDEGEPLYTEDYRQWRDDQPGWRPSLATIDNAGGWMALCEAAGVEAVGHGAPSRTEGEFLDAIIHVREIVGDWPTQRQYIEHKREADPSHTWVYRQGEDLDSWEDAIDAARYHASR